MSARVGRKPRAAVYHARGMPAIAWYMRFIGDSLGALCAAYRRAELNVGHGVIPWGRRNQKSVFAFGPAPEPTPVRPGRAGPSAPG